jgi:hypothetical protein
MRDRYGSNTWFGRAGGVLPDRLRFPPDASTSGGEARLPEPLQHTPKRWLWRHAQGSIRVQEGQPRNTSQYARRRACL